MRKLIFLGAVLSFGVVSAAPWLKGVTDKDPLSYKVGEEIVFTVTLEGVSAFPEGTEAKWKRTGDDGVEERNLVGVFAACGEDKAEPSGLCAPAG